MSRTDLTREEVRKVLKKTESKSQGANPNILMPLPYKGLNICRSNHMDLSDLELILAERKKNEKKEALTIPSKEEQKKEETILTEKKHINLHV